MLPESIHASPNDTDPRYGMVPHKASMLITSFQPSRQLARYISRYLVIDSTTFNVNHILPDSSLVMSFRLRGTITDSSLGTLPHTAISGIRKTDRFISYELGARNLLVIFQTGGASAFVREPLHEFSGISVGLDQLRGYHDLSRLLDEIYSTKDDETAIAAVEKLLLHQLLVGHEDLMVRRAIDQIIAHRGNIRINDLAAWLCISQDPLEKRFRRVIGVSPKQFAYISRIKHIIKGIRSNTYDDVQEAAYETGYFDLPHFYKDFKTFTGQTPSSFFRTPDAW